jgi:large subunit ribosomal protein L24
VIAGKDKGKKGKVRQALPKEGKVIVEGVNMIKRHSKTKGQARQAGIIELESPLHVSKVMFVCSKCNKPVRVGIRFLEDGKKARFCRACAEVID